MRISETFNARVLRAECLDKVNVGTVSADPGRFNLLKAELYWSLRERFEAGEISGLDDELAVSQLASIRYKHDLRGRVVIESKEDAKKRGVSSPDRAESLMLCFADQTPLALYWIREQGILEGVATRRVRKQQRTPKAQAQATGGRITTLDPAMLQPMVEAVVRQVTPQIISTLRDGNFLGPMQPVPPVPVGDETSVAWEYPPGYNVSIQPRKYTPISAQELQWIADNLDVLRQIIERRKAELCSLDFEIVFLDEDKDSSNDPTITKIREFLRFPGGRDWPWATWLGSLLEDIFVIDAPTIEPRYTYGGDLWALDIISGAMIMPLIDDAGRIPDPPNPGYSQIRYGLPKVFFTKDELLYMPKNRRPYSPIYGFSRVQGVIMSVSIAVRLEQRDLFYFTAGTIPDYLMTTPESWNGKQIAAFQTYWDNLMMGNMRARAVCASCLAV
jgi:hypothetical protein